MKGDSANIIQHKSTINYSYETIKITRSRISKGLLAIPISLKNLFPPSNKKIKVILDDSERPQVKNFTSFTSSTNESRIGGLKDWIDKNQIRDGDEILIQLIDRENWLYRLIPEKTFIFKLLDYQKKLDETKDINDVNQKLKNLAYWTQTKQQKTYLNEYLRLIHQMEGIDRKEIDRNFSRIRERTPINIRTVMGNLYNGLCQVCNFTFLKKDGKPYYEVHHLKPNLGHHPKNLILVCANCHCQFEYANLKTKFNDNGWLIEVYFNSKQYSINQAILNEFIIDFKKIIHL